MATRCGLRLIRRLGHSPNGRAMQKGIFHFCEFLGSYHIALTWGSYHIASTGHSANALGTLLLREVATRPGVLAGALTE